MDSAVTVGRIPTVSVKAIMAVTGVVLFGFVLVHMLGNFQIWLPNGPEAMHQYAVALRKLPGGLWVPRLVLLGSVLAHIASAVTLVQRNNAARPVAYKKARRDQATNYAARTMPISGVLVMLYIVYHLMHLTGGFGITGYDPQNPFNNVVTSFQSAPVALVYIVANLLLGLHLFHGAWAWFNSLGLNSPRYNPWRRRFAFALAGAITVGNVALPVTVLAGAIQPTAQTFCAAELGPCANASR